MPMALRVRRQISTIPLAWVPSSRGSPPAHLPPCGSFALAFSSACPLRFPVARGLRVSASGAILCASNPAFSCFPSPSDPRPRCGTSRSPRRLGSCQGWPDQFLSTVALSRPASARRSTPSRSCGRPRSFPHAGWWCGASCCEPRGRGWRHGDTIPIGQHQEHSETRSPTSRSINFSNSPHLPSRP